MVRMHEISIYEFESLESIEISAGRILLSNDNDVFNASNSSLKEAKDKAEAFFRTKHELLKELVCVKHNEQIKKIELQTGSWVELVGYIAGILESHGIGFKPFNYVFISIWIVKYGISKLCK